jgi:glycosyltransferase involved in cell wall biosynthesis
MPGIINMKKPVKVCFVAPKAYPLFNPDVNGVFGGAEVDLYTLATELAKDENFEVSFTTADYGQNSFEYLDGVKVIKSLNFAQNPLAGAVKIWEALKDADSDIYFQESTSAGTFLVGLFCRLHNKAFIYRTAHRNDCDGTYLKRHFFAGKGYCWALRHAKQVIVQNEYDVEDIKRTTGVDSVAIANAQQLPEQKSVSRDSILWVGRSAGFKRPELFLKLARHFPQENFVMICQHATGDESYEELMKEAFAIENLDFIRRVPFFEIDPYFSKAKLFVCTSSGEGFPNTYIQACKHAVPILSLKVNPDGFLERHECGLCAGGDWEKFLENFQVLSQRSEAERYGRNARHYAEQNHDIIKIIQRYKELFCEITSSEKLNPA